MKPTDACHLHRQDAQLYGFWIRISPYYGCTFSFYLFIYFLISTNITNKDNAQLMHLSHKTPPSLLGGQNHMTSPTTPQGLWADLLFYSPDIIGIAFPKSAVGQSVRASFLEPWSKLSKRHWANDRTHRLVNFFENEDHQPSLPVGSYSSQPARNIEEDHQPRQPTNDQSLYQRNGWDLLLIFRLCFLCNELFQELLIAFF